MSYPTHVQELKDKILPHLCQLLAARVSKSVANTSVQRQHWMVSI